MNVPEAKRILLDGARELVISLKWCALRSSNRFMACETRPQKEGAVAPDEASPLRNYSNETLAHKALLWATSLLFGGRISDAKG
ncbi:hypothetical protein [Streptomyces sp. NPDC002533]